MVKITTATNETGNLLDFIISYPPKYLTDVTDIYLVKITDVTI